MFPELDFSIGAYLGHTGVVVDNTFANSTPANIAPTIETDVMITKGRYRLTFSNPVGLDIPFDKQSDLLTFVDDSGAFQQKRYTVDALSLNTVSNTLSVDITIIDNPIPLIVVYGAVFAVVAIVGALSVNSVLEKIEPITAPIGNILGGVTGKMLALGTLAVFLIPVVLKAKG